MSQPIAPPRLSTRARTALQMVLGFALSTAMLTPRPTLAAEPDAGASAATPAAAPFATEEWQLEQKRQAPETGRATRAWLQAQGHREQASTNRPTLSGPALRRAHDRYMRTFEVDVPQQLRESVPSNK